MLSTSRGRNCRTTFHRLLQLVSTCCNKSEAMDKQFSYHSCIGIKEMILYQTYINSVSPVKTVQHNHKFLLLQLFGKMVSFCYSALCTCGNHPFYWLKTCKILVTFAQVGKVSWLPYRPPTELTMYVLFCMLDNITMTHDNNIDLNLSHIQL
jgi:hypothetical protein